MLCICERRREWTGKVLDQRNKLRNSLRFLLGVLHDFSAANYVPAAELLPVRSLFFSQCIHTCVFGMFFCALAQYMNARLGKCGAAVMDAVCSGGQIFAA